MKKRFDLETKALCLLIIISGAAASVSLTELFTVTPSTVRAQNESSVWKSTFDVEDCDFASSGKNTYFILEPGYKLVLEDQDGEGTEELQLVVTVSK